MIDMVFAYIFLPLASIFILSMISIVIGESVWPYCPIAALVSSIALVGDIAYLGRTGVELNVR